MKSFSNISPGSKIFTQSDTFNGDFLIGPMAPIEYRCIYGSSLVIEKHVIIGAGSIVLPGAKFGEGVAIGANSLVKEECMEWSIYAGSPVKFIKERSKKLLELEKKVL
jgi:galactoside O-acetyltransferase